MKIEVCGPGCPRCQETLRRVMKASEELGMDAKVEHVHDFVKMAEYGIMMTPAIVIDGEIKISGKIPEMDEIKAILIEASKK